MSCSADKSKVVAEALRSHRAALANFVRARVPLADALDVLQTAALRALEKAETLRQPHRVLPWLYRLHRNVIQDAIRARTSENKVFDRFALPREPEQETPPERCGCSARLAQTLPREQAGVLTLVDLADTPIAAAASSLKVSVNAATVRLHRARKALRTRMAEHCGVTSSQQCRDCRCSRDGC